MGANQAYYSFVGGINTEASPLSFPENTAYDMDNVILQRDGSIRCRLGLQYEADYARVGPVTIDGTTPVTANRAKRMATGVGVWPSVGGDGELEFTVVQMGNILYIHDSSKGSISGNLKFSIDLDIFKITSISYEDKVQFATGNGYLFVAGPQIDPFYVIYDPDTDSISVQGIAIQIRDFEDLEPEQANDFRPGTLTPEHAYWLRNAHWLPTYTVDGFTDPITFIYSRANAYPSKADIIYSGKKVDDNGNEILTWQTLAEQTFGNTPAPQGHYIVNAFDIDRSGVSAYPAAAGIPKEVEKGRPSTIAFYSGRAWYSGLPIGKNTGKIYYSQLVEYDHNIYKCYQEADPTAEDVSDLVDTDGGVINIPDAGAIKKMVPIARSLLVFATNGVWEITGIDGSFKATEFSVNRVGFQGVQSADAIVVAESEVYFVGNDGLYKLTKEDFNVTFVIQDLSSTTIQSLLNSISPYGKDFALGVYDNEERRITWFFNNTEDNDGTNYRFLYNRAIVLDLNLEAFYPLTFATAVNYPIVGGVAAARKYTYTADPTTIFDSSIDDVVDSAGLPVFLDTQRVVKDPVQYKFLSIWRDKRNGQYYYTFSELANENFRDWENFDNRGLTYSCYLETGYFHGGNAALNKGTQYVYCFLKRTESGFELNSKGELVMSDPSSCLMSIKWSWADTAASNKWSTPREVYRYRRFYQPVDVNDSLDYGQAVITSKNRVRGRGQALRMRFENTPGKNFHLLGWHTYYNGNANP